MRLEASMNMRQEMRLKLAPQIIQSIEILQLPLLELADRIDQELLENPLLEVSQSSEEEGREEGAEAETGEDANAEDAEFDDVETVTEEAETEPEPIEEEDYDALEDMLPSYLEHEGRRSSSGDGERDGKLAALENSAAPDVSLEDHLSSQLALFDLDERTRVICENIIANMDWRGYLVYPIEEIVASMEGDVRIEEGQEALRVVQQLEPPGVGARDLSECLLLQLDEEQPSYELLKKLIEDCLDDVVKNRYPRVAKTLGVSIEKLKGLVDEIGHLNPIPGALFGEGMAPHVIPDLSVEMVEGEYRVMLEDTSLPSLRICSYYARKLQQEGLDPKTEEYLRKKLQSARWLIDAIQQRRSTLFNIATAIVEAQQEFMDKGAMYLKPLKMQDIADEVGVHVSTVSRALSGKYIQTPRGIFSLKHFFTGGVEKDDGEMESWEVVRQKLQQVIDEEDKSKPLSDEAVAEILSEQGIDIARRTVSKYRKVLGIPSSRQRKEF